MKELDLSEYENISLSELKQMLVKSKKVLKELEHTPVRSLKISDVEHMSDIRNRIIPGISLKIEELESAFELF